MKVRVVSIDQYNQRKTNLKLGSANIIFKIKNKIFNIKNAKIVEFIRMIAILKRKNINNEIIKT